MSKESRWMLAALAASCFAAVPPLASTGPAGAPPPVLGELDATGTTHQLLGLRVATDAGGPPVVTLAIDGEVSYQDFLLDSPPRLVLDMPGVVNRLDQYKFAVDRGGVVRARAGQHQLEPVPITRVVFDLDAPLAYDIRREPSALVVAFAGAIAPATTAIARDAAPRPSASSAAEPAPIETEDLVREIEARADAPAAQAPAPVWPAASGEATTVSRAVRPGVIQGLLAAPRGGAASGRAAADDDPEATGGYEMRRIVTDAEVYSGERISLNLVDADVKNVFRLFHEISGLNFVLDPTVSGRVTIVLDNVPWDQALDIILKNNGLDKVLENNVVRIAPTQKLAQEAAQRKQLKEAKELEVEPITITRTLSYGKADDVEKVIRDSGILTARGKVIVDERTNTVIISDIPKKVEPLDVLISTLDTETPQVMIEARVVETSRDFVQDLGVVWGLTAIADASRGTATGLTFPHNASVRYGLNLPGTNQASNLAFRFGNVIDSFTLDVALNTLETEGQARVLSSPKIATQNNERAEIEQGVRIPIVNTTATEINVEFVSASLKMVVTPQITAEGTIILEVLVENNSPDFVQTAGGIPSINTQRAQTKVLINDGGTTVIGGIFTINEGRSEVGVPWFRKVPVFGWLFKSQNITNRNRELLIFITPKIMRVA